MKAKLTAQFINNIKPQEKPYEARDTVLKGFIARIQPSGTIAYYYSYRDIYGRKKRVNLGKHGTLSTTQARKAAERMAGRVALQQDPAEDKKRKRVALVQKQAEEARQRTLKQFIEGEYQEWCSANKRKARENIQMLLTGFKEYHHIKLSELTSWQFEKWRAQRIKAGTAPSTINRYLGEIKALLNRAVDWGFLDKSPLTKLKMIKVDNARTRYLSTQEESILRKALVE